VVSAVVLALIMSLFPEGPQRVRAMGYFGFIMAGGGSLGVLLGGLIVNLLDWRWIFLVKPARGRRGDRALAAAAARRRRPARQRLDVAGAVTVTAALMWPSTAS
jgi:MFS family permease